MIHVDVDAITPLRLRHYADIAAATRYYGHTAIRALRAAHTFCH